MSRKKRKITLEQHIQLGFALKLTRDFIVILLGKLQDAYPLHTLPVKHAKAALRELDSLRSELDDRVSEENPRVSDDIVIGAYYGSRAQRCYDLDLLDLFEDIRKDLSKEEPLTQQGEE